jgi:fimbrial chaperone protein
LFRKPSLHSLLVLSFGLAICRAEFSFASAYRVTPVQILLSRGSASALLTLKNETGEALRFQINAVAWDQDSKGQMRVSPTRDILLFPTLLSVAAGEERKIRVASSVPFGNVERTYRIFFEELPPPEKPDSAKSEVRILTRMGIPIFLAPERPDSNTRLEVSPMRSGVLSLSVRNGGNVHFTLRGVLVKGLGQDGETVFERRAEGWYVLAGGSRDYEIEIPREHCGKVKNLHVEAQIDRRILSEKLEISSGACAP